MIVYRRRECTICVLGHIVFPLLFDNNFAHSKTESAASQDSGVVYNMSIRSSLPLHIFILRFRPYFCPHIKCLAKILVFLT